jgi:hypothetical protein
MALTRTRHTMPNYIRDALTKRKLMDAYHERPDYQQNDYIGWLCVKRAKHEETKQKRHQRKRARNDMFLVLRF